MRKELSRISSSILLAISVICCAAGVVSAKPPEKAPRPYDATDKYEVRDMEGWRVLVNRDLINKRAELCRDTLKLLQYELFQIDRMLPKAAVEKLRKITIWVEAAEPHHACMTYHPSAKWLVENNMNPEKARCVEIANAKNFLAWNRHQPWMVLHELAHGYHDQFLPGGYDNPPLVEAYRAAKEAGIYDAVLLYRGIKTRAYAMNNQMEYFAEATEAFFGTNDFYPFVSAELKEHDPRAYKLLRKLWGVQ
jgi:hypothetical protein